LTATTEAHSIDAYEYEFEPLPGDLLLHVLLSQCVFWRRESAELKF